VFSATERASPLVNAGASLTSVKARCKATEAQLQNTTTDVAIDLCGKKSVVSLGGDVQVDNATRTVTSPTGAFVTVDNDPANPGSSQTLVPVQVTALNGTDNNQLYLHSKALTLPVTNVLVGKLKKGKKPYGKSLDVTIPQLLAGELEARTWRIVLDVVGEVVRAGERLSGVVALTTCGRENGGQDEQGGEPLPPICSEPNLHEAPLTDERRPRGTETSRAAQSLSTPQAAKINGSGEQGAEGGEQGELGKAMAGREQRAECQQC